MKIKFIIFSIIAVLIFIFLLNLIGEVFVKEIAQEVFIENRGVAVSKANLDKPAPTFELLELYGGKAKLSEFLGSPVVLTFWTTWNSISTDQIKILDDYLAKNSENLFKIVTINNQEDRSTVFNFIERGGYKIRILLDQSGIVGESYNIRTLPTTYFLDKDGVIKDIFIGVLNERMLVDKIERTLK